MPARTAIHAFLGTDEALVKEAAMKLAGKLTPKDNEFGLEIVSGSADNADQAVQVVANTIEAIQTLPFFGGDKVVWLQGVNFFGDSQTAKAESTLSAIDTLLNLLEAGLPPDVTFLLSAGEIDKRRNFYKRLLKVAKVEVHDRLDATKTGWEVAVMGHVADRAEHWKMKFQGAALEQFTQRVGANTRSIDSELEKLSLYTEGRPVTEDDVAAVISQSHTGYIFDIGEAIGDRNLPRTLHLIDFQLRRGENAVALLLAAIVPKVRGLLHARDLAESHGVRAGRHYPDFQQQLARLPASATGHIGRTKEGKLNAYPLFLASQRKSRYTLAELVSGVEACLEANLRLVTTQLDPRLVLHQLAARLVVGAKPKSSNR